MGSICMVGYKSLRHLGNEQPIIRPDGHSRGHGVGLEDFLNGIVTRPQF